MASMSAVPAKVSFPLIDVPKSTCRPILCSMVFFCCDIVGLVLAITAVFWVEHASGGSPDVHRYLALWPALGVVLAMFCATNLYPGVIYNAVAELRRLCLALFFGLLVIAALVIVTRNAVYPRSLLVATWLIATILIPVLRTVVRGVACHSSWWGIPIAFFYTGEESCDILLELQTHPEIGLRPVVVFSESPAARSHLSVPVVDLRLAAAVRASGVELAMIVLPSAGSTKLLQNLESFDSVFPRLMIVHSSAAPCSVSVDARELRGRLAVDLKRNLLLPLPRLTKRAIDLLIIFATIPVIALTVAFLAALIKIESPGPAFFGHRRIGFGHTSFRIWKLRTMRLNADELLQNTLAGDEKMRQEWLLHRKLRHDPRVTRVGRLLRKTSLDELPQIWNVLRGEMSLVGPRPIVEEEIANYGQSFALYCRVTPGVTGLWQISGRNDVCCRDRVRLDSYYVRNWSPWLDLYILARTAKVVITGVGAY